MPSSPAIDSSSPFAAGRRTIYLVGSEHDPAVIAETIADSVPANSSMSPATTPVPKPIRWIAGLIAAIRWLPFAWQLLRSIPSEARQAWNSAFGNKQE